MEKSYYILLGIEHTLTNSNFGLKGKSPNFSFPFQILGPRPKSKRKWKKLTLDATSLLSLGYPCTLVHISMHITSKVISSSLLSHSRPQAHTHTTKISQTLSRSLKNTPSSPLQKSRKLGAFKRILQVNHHLR